MSTTQSQDKFYSSTVNRDRLQDIYESLEEFQGYSINYGLLFKLGYKSASDAWNDNPIVVHSVDPRDYKREDHHFERWAISQGNIDDSLIFPDDLKQLNSSDELTVMVRGRAVVVYRNGVVSNRFADGSVGVSSRIRDEADEANELFDPSVDDTTAVWIDVIVDTEGNFVALRDTDSYNTYLIIRRK